MSTSATGNVAAHALVDFTLVSKKAIHLAEQQCSRANSLIQAAQSLLDDTEALVHKWTFIHKAIEVQLDVAVDIRQNIEKQSRQLQHFQQEKLQEHRALCKALEEITVKLRETQIDPAISSGSLFDHIDDNTMNELSQAVTAELSKIKDLQQRSAKELNRVKNAAESLATSLQSTVESLPNVEMGLQNARNRLHDGERNADAMAEILLSLMRHYNQVTEALKAFQAGEEQNDEDLQVLALDTKELTSVMDELQGFFGIIEHMHSDVQLRHQTFHSAYTNMVRLVHLLFQMGDELEDVVPKVKAIDFQLDSVKSTVDRALDRLFSLISRCETFVLSYHSLILEIERRTRAHKVIDALVSKFRDAAAVWLEEEKEARRKFVETHGESLPVSLCVTVMDPAPEFHLDVINDHQIPVITPTNVEASKQKLLQSMKTID